MSTTYCLKPYDDIVPLLSGEVVPRWAVQVWEKQGSNTYQGKTLDRLTSKSDWCGHFHRSPQAAEDCAIKTIQRKNRRTS